ncbi:MAG: hypothetical protein BAJALOKI3v1_10072 [Promethearchaeota archaeon]|jgi:hypothetical protein|nr:MAG: hypothetical protein BAJALOKI3v1_10072 [Candidatus Lokiarchaeota archaeon]
MIQLEQKTFDLNFLQNFFTPIDNLEGKLNRLDSKFSKYNELNDKLDNQLNQELLSVQLKNLYEIINSINENIVQINQKNLETFLNFQDILVSKYKQLNIDRLKQLDINQEDMKQVGLSLIGKKKTAKIIYKASFTPSIEIDDWMDLLDYLRNNSLFISIIDDVESYYEKILERKLAEEISKIPDDFDNNLIEDYKIAFWKNSDLTFEKYIRNIQQEQIKREIEKKGESIQEAKKKDELEELKKNQEEQRKLYEDYLKYSDREFERRRRKEKREKLSEIAQKPKKQDGISEDVEEKIKKFKSKFENSFEDKYLIQKDDTTDPRNIVRNRKKKKEEEYQKYLKKFKDNSNNKD